MSEIKALEKLRNTIVTYAADCDERWMLAACDEIEAEIADKQEAIRKRCKAECVHWENEMHKVLDALNGSERFWGACMEYPLDEHTIPPSEIAKKILSDRYMLLPVDANNEPIHVGDVLEHVDGRLNKQAVGCVCKFGFNDSSVWCARDFRHVKPRTLEDVLREFANSGTPTGDGGVLFETALIEKYADKLRELLLGGDAE